MELCQSFFKSKSELFLNLILYTYGHLSLINCWSHYTVVGVLVFSLLLIQFTSPTTENVIRSCCWWKPPLWGSLVVEHQQRRNWRFYFIEHDEQRGRI